jgi:hypothetical protein
MVVAAQRANGFVLSFLILHFTVFFAFKSMQFSHVRRVECHDFD